MVIDPLWFILGIELLAVLTGVSLYLGYKIYSQSRRRKREESVLLKAIDTTIKLLKENIGRVQERDTESSMRKKGLELEVQIIEALRDSLKKGLIDSESFNETFYEHSQKAVGEFITWFKAFTEKKDEIIARARAALKERDDALKKLQDALRKKKAQLQDLISKTETQKNILKRWQFIKEQNKKLKQMIEELKVKAQEAEQLKEIVSALEATNRELTTCVEVLEEENNRLTQQLIQYKKMLDILDESGQIIEKVQNSEGLQDLLLELKQKDEEIKRLRKELQTLEHEYMVLYQKMAMKK
ncbi:MAG: hypothetical protein D6778_03680 [Nitrospirae bacterium]|nr:MAG: hypothetical protein D6778_03680 [Nitrospirota bacterium]